MTADDCKSYLLYLNNAIQFNNQYNNAYHYSINKKPIDADYSALTKKSKQIIKLLDLKLIVESELISIKMLSVKVTL